MTATAVFAPPSMRAPNPREALRRFGVWLATVLTDGGKAIITNRIIQAGTAPKYIGWGTGVQTTATTSDTGLGPTTVERDVDLAGTSGTRTTGAESRTTTTVTNDTYTVTGTRTATGSGTVTTAGTFDNATIASGSLCIKGDFAGIALASGDSIAFTINLKIA